MKDGSTINLHNPTDMPDPVKVENISEPWIKATIICPDEYLGSVMGDITSRRGTVKGYEPRGNTQVLNAAVPLAQMFGYATDLRSSSQGRATFTMEPLKYSQVPSNVAEVIINKSE